MPETQQETLDRRSEERARTLQLLNVTQSCNNLNCDISTRLGRQINKHSWDQKVDSYNIEIYNIIKQNFKSWRKA